MPLDEQRDLALLALGAVLGSTTVSKKAFDLLSGEDLGEKDLEAVFEELKAGRGAGETVRLWMKRRGVTVNGKVIESVLEEITRKAKIRRTQSLATKLSLAASAGDEELIRECLTRLEALRKQ